MKINLLSKPGTYRKQDLQDIKVDSALISDISLNFKKDFESSHTVMKTKIRNSKKMMILYCFSVFILILCSIYYQLSFNSKTSLKPDNLLSLIEYAIDNNELHISEISYKDYSLSIKIIYNSEAVHKDVKLKTLITSFSDQSNFNLDVSYNGQARLLSLYFPPFVELKGDNFVDNGLTNDSSINTISVDSLFSSLSNILIQRQIKNFHLFQDEKSEYFNIAIFAK